MELAFESQTLRDLCEREGAAVRELGTAAAKHLQIRVSDLEAATSVNDLLLGNPRVLGNAKSSLYAVDLSEKLRIVFTPGHVSVPKIKSGQVDWPKVRRIKILRIENNHA